MKDFLFDLLVLDMARRTLDATMVFLEWDRLTLHDLKLKWKAWRARK